MKATPTLEETRRYADAFIAALRDCGHSAENVRQVLRDYASMIVAAPAPSAAPVVPNLGKLTDAQTIELIDAQPSLIVSREAPKTLRMLTEALQTLVSIHDRKWEHARAAHTANTGVGPEQEAALAETDRLQTEIARLSAGAYDTARDALRAAGFVLGEERP